MQSIIDTINTDDRLDRIDIEDVDAHTFPSETSPVLATPAIIGGAALIGAGALYGQAID